MEGAEPACLPPTRFMLDPAKAQRTAGRDVDQTGTARTFGTLPDGREVAGVRLRAGELAAEFIGYGAVLRDLRLDGVRHPLVLGFDALDDYLVHSRYFGATAGRFANRIAEGRFTLDGRTYQLDRNFRARHHLHGGVAGLGKRVWDLVDAAEDAATFRIVSPDGDGGYPGRVEVRARFTLVPPATLRISYEARTDAPTIVNLAHHSYFNLDGRPDCLGHSLEIAADAYLPVNDTLIPTGEMAPVEGTPFDFRRPRAIGDSGLDYDHNFCLAPARRSFPAFAARATGSDGNIALEVWTTEPGLQFYDGAKLDVPVPGLDGRRYGRNAGFCLEPQIWPDAPNRPGFPSAVLLPGGTYAQTSEFRFAQS